MLPFAPKTSIIIMWTIQLVTLLAFPISVFTVVKLYLRFMVCPLLVYRGNTLHCFWIAIHIIWNILNMKTSFDAFISNFQLIMRIVTFTFYRVCWVYLSNKCISAFCLSKSLNAIYIRPNLQLGISSIHFWAYYVKKIFEQA